MRTNNVRKGTGDERLYPQVVLSGTATLDELAQRISDATAFTAADIKGVVSALSDEIALAAAQGKSVRIDGLGTFRARLAVAGGGKGETAGSKAKLTAPSVHVSGLYVKPSNALVQATATAARLERVRDDGKPARKPLEPEKRLDALRKHLAKNGFISCPTYAALTRLSRSAATKELRELSQAQDAFITAEGAGSHRVYVGKNA